MRVQTTAKNNRKFIPLGIKRTLLLLLFALAVQMGINAEEIFNKPIVETYKQSFRTNEFHMAGVDQDGDGFADFFIAVPYVNRDPLLTRLAGFLREGATVSYDDKGKSSDGTELDTSALLEINGRSVLQIFPNEEVNFPTEATRQKRLRN